jgi:hypothetical protein
MVPISDYAWNAADGPPGLVPSGTGSFSKYQKTSKVFYKHGCTSAWPNYSFSDRWQSRISPSSTGGNVELYLDSTRLPALVEEWLGDLDTFNCMALSEYLAEARLSETLACDD